MEHGLHLAGTLFSAFPNRVRMNIPDFRSYMNIPPTSGEAFGERCHEAVSGKQSGLTHGSFPPHPHMMHMLGRGQWARQCSIRAACARGDVPELVANTATKASNVIRAKKDI